MDNTQGTAPGSPSSGTPGTGGADPREELRAQLQAMSRAAGELLEHLVKVPATLAQIPLQVLPEDTATHARNAASEGFAAVRSLVDSMSRGIDQIMREQRDRMANMGSTRTGVGGTGSPDASADPHTASSTTSTTTSTRALDADTVGDVVGEDRATGYLGGHGPGAGPDGSDGAAGGSGSLD